MVKIVILVLITEIVVAIGQIFFKKATNSIETYSLRGAHTHIRFVKDVLRMPRIWIGLGIMTIGLVLWLFALAEGDLSLVYPIGSLQYILILVLAHFYLDEKIDRVKLAGTLLVMAGIVLITMG